MRSTRATTGDEIQRTSSGTSEPGPRTWRSIGPRLTVSIQTVSFATVGAAGSSLDNPKVTSETTAIAATMRMFRLIRRFSACPLRGISISFLRSGLRTAHAKVSDAVSH